MKKFSIGIILFFMITLASTLIAFAGTGFRITEKDPASGIHSFPVNDKITITTSADVDEDTVANKTVYLRDEDTLDKVECDLKVSGDRIRIYPDDDLEYETWYRVFVTDGVKDMDGNRIEQEDWSFRTGGKGSENYDNSDDDSSDIIDKRDPEPDEEDVPIDVIIKIKFEEDMDGDSLEDYVWLEEDDSGDNVDFNASYNEDDRTLEIEPDNNLDTNTDYVIGFDRKIENEDGDKYSIDEWTFRTGDTKENNNSSPEDYISDTLIEKRYPQKNGYMNSVSDDITFTFDRDVRTETVNASSVLLKESGSIVPVNCVVTYNYQTHQVTVTPFKNLKSNMQYIISLNESIKDMDGRAMPKTSWTFLTQSKTNSTVTTGLNILVDGQKINFSGAAPYVKNGHTYVAIRPLFEAVGAQVTWDGNKNMVFARKGIMSVEMYIGSRKAYKNGESVTIEAAPEIYKNKAMIPLRFASEALGYDVSWDERNKTIQMTHL